SLRRYYIAPVQRFSGTNSSRLDVDEDLNSRRQPSKMSERVARPNSRIDRSPFMTRIMQLTFSALFCACVAGRASAVTITLELNGFPNAMGGQLTGPGLEPSIPLPAGKQQIELANLVA